MENRRLSMEGDSNEELQIKLLTPDRHDRKGGMKTMPFIIVNEAFEKVASYGLMPNMIFYLMEVYHMEAATGTSILSVWSAFSNGLSIFGAIISDSYLGRFRVIVMGSISALLGMTFLWLTTMFPQLRPSSCHELDSSCSPATATQLAFLFSCFGLLSIGSGCIGPCSIAFGADQLRKHDRASIDNLRIIDSYFNWYYASIAISTVFAFTFVVYIQDQFGWEVGFAVPVLIMLCSTLMFLLGSSLYVKIEVSQSPFSGFIQVLILAFKNRKISLSSDDCYNHANGMDRVELTESLRFLNKACVVRDSNMDSSVLNPSSLSTVEKVESLKSLIRLVPVWSSGILLSTVASQNFPTLQAKTMNRQVTSWFEIPAGSFNVFLVLTVSIWIVFYDRILVPLLAKHTHEPRGLPPKTRMGIGFLISVGAMVVSAVVETVRRDLSRSHDNPNTTIVMSSMWLVPQYALLGVAEAFNAIAQIEFFYSELPKSMSSVVMALYMMSVAISGLVGSLLISVVDSVTSEEGKVSWLSSDINEGHIDYYYWFLAFVSLLNFFYFLICCRVHRSISPEKSKLSDELIGEEDSDIKHGSSTVDQS
ncbi:protein NRT1/ PTR FAMILY 1.2-like [Cynara cardunculus var. scolymus]|uniref:Major facilitator superfamily domain, general substrate transporter n=1 Tax=Cynara cardunculus var. scolymus TaxID=59895 RepID=A0A103XZS2_CYNCS|nr:protein NRT1/ PTR FAMILY 1.2-like [Cynara cardunculus var. scolymus]KVH99883.1 Major facilitator superfamily domain, general substrate transporter [Cynara cardunculus var. scolymus]